MLKIVHYRGKCIGCGVCHEQQASHWVMSKKDGKAVLLKAVVKKDVHVLSIPQIELERSKEVAALCPVNVIKIS